MIFIDPQNGIKSPVQDSLLQQAALRTIEHQKVTGPSDLTIVLSNDEHLHELNRLYLGMDAPTDVLSFPFDETDPDTGSRYLGDIIISLSRAATQAEAVDHPVGDELQLLVVHGTLHLLGHDHAEPEEKARMWQAQSEILASLGLANIIVREE
jgi:probable rRNA maturation factor